MTKPRPPLTDRFALQRNRLQRTMPDAMFLHDRARDEIEDRLSMVNKSFDNAVVVTGHPEAWQDVTPNCQTVDDEDLLDFPSGALDLVIHAMSLHWSDDPVGQLIQCKRALKPDGLLLAVFPAGRTLSELRAVLGQAETETRGGLSPRVLPMADIRDLGALLQRAGFALPVADASILNVEYRDLWSLMRDLRAMGEANALTARDKAFPGRAFFERAASIYAKSYPGTQNAVRCTYELISLAGWAPDPSQAQPLRPGSAKTRLADALGATETSLPD